MQPGILLVGNHPPPYGGVPTHIEYLARHLSVAGWRVQVLSFARAGVGQMATPGYRVHRPRVARWAGLALPSGRVSPAASFRAFRQDSPSEFFTTLAIAKQILRLVSRHDLSLVSAYHLLPSGLAAAWACEQAGLPLVVTVFGELYAAPEAHQARRAEIKYIVEQSRHVLSCSQHCASSLEPWAPRKPTRVVYYGVDLERFSPRVDGRPLRIRLGIEPHQPVVVFVGRLHREMGLQTVLDALPVVASRHPEVVFLLVGATGPMLRDALRVQSQYPLNVRVLPDACAEDVPLAYAAADLVIAPSINQRACLGLALIEAMASAKPVIGCAVGGTTEVVTNETGMLIPPASTGDLARAVTRLLEAPDLRRTLGAAGRRAAEERFDFRLTCTRMEAIFQDALS